MKAAKDPAADPALLHLLGAREQFLAYIRRRVADAELAEDILQETLLRALQAAPELHDETRLTRWFYTVVQHAIVDAYRRRAVERKHTVATEGAAWEAMPAVEEEQDGDATLCACVHALIPTLKPEYADLVQALDLDGEAPEAAARRLGISGTNLKVRRHRARQALRQRLLETCRLCAQHHCLDCTCGSTSRLPVV